MIIRWATHEKARFKELSTACNSRVIFQVLKKYIIASKKIRFEGNGYGDEWIKEAAKRGLSNIADVPEALKAFVTKHTKDVFKNSEVLTERELEARYDIRLEIYTKKIQSEARVLGDLIRNHIIPTVIKYQNEKTIRFTSRNADTADAAGINSLYAKKNQYFTRKTRRRH